MINLLTIYYVDEFIISERWCSFVDQFNLLFAGILKGFENVNEGIDLREMYSKNFTAVQFYLYPNC